MIKNIRVSNWTIYKVNTSFSFHRILFVSIIKYFVNPNRVNLNNFAWLDNINILFYLLYRFNLKFSYGTVKQKKLYSYYLLIWVNYQIILNRNETLHVISNFRYISLHLYYLHKKRLNFIFRAYGECGVWITVVNYARHNRSCL